MQNTTYSPNHAPSNPKKEKTRVQIHQNALLAKIACKILKQKDVALTLRKTIYLSDSSPRQFLQNRRWVAHELAHVQQFMQYGTICFIFKYLLESLAKGYYNNKWEVAARAEEHNLRILDDFIFEYTD